MSEVKYIKNISELINCRDYYIQDIVRFPAHGIYPKEPAYLGEFSGVDQPEEGNGERILRFYSRVSKQTIPINISEVFGGACSKYLISEKAYTFETLEPTVEKEKRTPDEVSIRLSSGELTEALESLGYDNIRGYKIVSIKDVGGDAAWVHLKKIWVSSPSADEEVK